VDMVAFQTLFLGLVFGFAPVRVMVGPPVASVQIVLDGAVIGTVTAEPWEVAATIAFLASEYSSYLTGEVISISSQHA